MSAEVGDRFLDACAGSQADALDDLRPRPVLRIPGQHAVLVTDPARTWRLEAGAQELVALALERHLGLGDDDAWLSAGLTHYVTRLVTRTREVLRTADRTTDGFVAWLDAPDASVHLLRAQDWLGACHDLLTKDPPPALAESADKDLRHLRPDDLLLGHGLAAWLVEGHPEHAAAFLRAVGRTEPDALEAAARAHLGYDLPELQARLTRWLAETLGRLDRRSR